MNFAEMKAIKNATTNVIRGTDADDDIVGTAQGDYLAGFYGNDRLRGGDGNDFLVGWAGDDIFGGGSGKDIAYHWAGNGAERDVFRDFEHGVDAVCFDLRGTLYELDDIVITQVGSNRFEISAGDSKIVVIGSNTFDAGDLVLWL